MLPTAAYELAQQQLGVISRVQLGRWWRDNQIDHRIGPGRELLRLERGIYVLNGAGHRQIHAALAAALRAGPAATATGPAVLGELGLESFVGSASFEVLTAPGRRLRGARFRHRPDPDPARKVRELGQIRLARPVDALIDAAAFAGEVKERDLRITFDQCRWRKLLTRDELVARIGELGAGAPGGAILTKLFEADGFEPESEGERQLGRLLRAFDPAPDPQVHVTPRRRVDWYFRSVRFAYEYLGSVDHEGAAAREADDARNEELRDQGVRIGYVTKDDLKSPQPLMAAIVGRLAVRAHELGVTGPVATRDA